MPDHTTITEPGIYFDIRPIDYFADPCPTPSLTQSIAKILLERSPLHAWHAHPRLNPKFEPDDSTKFDVGNIAHKLLIGRGKEIVVLDFNDWRTKASQEAREAAAADGKLAVLGKKFALAERMVSAAREQLELRGLGDLFRDGNGEAVACWQERGLWHRQMIDWLSPDLKVFADYKTTDMSAAPHGIGRMMVNAGWPIQGAFAERGLSVLDPKNQGRRRYFFVVQETEAPYCLTVVELSEAVMTMGRKMLDHAIDIWRDCIAQNRWPGYPTEVVMPEYPGWAESQWLNREITEAARERQPKTIAPDHLMAG